MIKFISLGKIIPEICPDPVFSLNNNFLIPEDEYPKLDVSNTILISGKFEKKWVKAFVKQAHSMNYKVGSLPNPDSSFEFLDVDYTIPLPLSPLEWYGLLANAAGYVGMRFHALVSCIANNTPVINVDNHPRSLIIKSSSKMYDLCQRVGIPHRYYSLRKINRTDPALILENLFDSQSMYSINNYARLAKNNFCEIIEKILRIATIKS